MRRPFVETLLSALVTGRQSEILTLQSLSLPSSWLRGVATMYPRPTASAVAGLVTQRLQEEIGRGRAGRRRQALIRVVVTSNRLQTL